MQQMPGTWDYQCMYEGIPNGNILQVQCSCHTRGCGGLSHYRCVQYPDECDAGTMTGFTIPLQQTCPPANVSFSLSLSLSTI